MFQINFNSAFSLFNFNPIGSTSESDDTTTSFLWTPKKLYTPMKFKTTPSTPKLETIKDFTPKDSGITTGKDTEPVIMEIAQNYGIVCPKGEKEPEPIRSEIMQNYGIVCPKGEKEPEPIRSEIMQNYGIVCPTAKEEPEESTRIASCTQNYAITCYYDIAAADIYKNSLN